MKFQKGVVGLAIENRCKKNLWARVEQRVLKTEDGLTHLQGNVWIIVDTEPQEPDWTLLPRSDLLAPGILRTS